VISNTALSIGEVAKSVLAVSQNLTVINGSSRGIFLKSPTRWILFLSFESIPGPLTINLSSETASYFEDVQGGDILLISKQQLRFPEKNVTISIAKTPVWRANLPVISLIPKQREEFATNLKMVKDPLLDKILSPIAPEIPMKSPLDQGILMICSALRERRYSILHEFAEDLLGLGKGLTPEGDDFLIGLSLSIASQPTSRDIEYVKSIIKNLIQSAYSKTTRISANLLECAANGQADERLCRVLQAVNENNGYAQAIQELLLWGNSSGRMALIGITTGILYACSSKAP